GLHHTSVVEIHHGQLSFADRGPFRQAGMVRIACAGETDPGLTHFSRKRQRLGSTTGVIHAKIRIVEDERNLTTVEGPRPSVKHWSLPSEQVDVRRRGTQGSLAPRLRSRGFAEAIARDGDDIK